MTVSPAWSADEAGARALDDADALADMRSQFAIPLDAAGAELTYLCGHSLGLAPRGARAQVLAELQDWERLGVLGHEHARRPWVGYAELLRPPLAQLAGAQPGEVVAMNSLSINLHLLLAAFYRPTTTRHAILIEAGAFPSDRHIVTSQLRWHGLDPRTALIELTPRAGEECLRAEDIEAAIATHAPRLALVLWPGVQYRTGQAFDLAAIVRSAHRAGARAGFDLAHAVGNVALNLHEDGADFAAWCSYKYLNGGPGAIAGAFVHERHERDATLTRLSGWWAHEAATRFRMGAQLVPARGADGWQVSNPPIFSAAPLIASLAQFSAAGLPRLRAKSVALTAYLEFCLRALCGGELEVLTPVEPALRGCQLAVRLRAGSERARHAHAALMAEGVITDWREPDTIRLAPVPLYNRYADALRAAQQLARSLHNSGP